MRDKRLIVLFGEGDTEEVFYKNLIEFWREEEGNSETKIKVVNIHGIGKYNKAPFKYKSEIRRDCPDYQHEIFLAYDSDVFEFAAKPPVDWGRIEKQLRDSGAFSVTHLKAERMIEDWLILDVDGLCKALKIKKPKKLVGATGHEKIKKLFLSANKVYQKGYSMKEYITKLNMGKIVDGISTTLNNLKSSIYPKN